MTLSSKLKVLLPLEGPSCIVIFSSMTFRLLDTVHTPQPFMTCDQESLESDIPLGEGTALNIILETREIFTWRAYSS